MGPANCKVNMPLKFGNYWVLILWSTLLGNEKLSMLWLHVFLDPAPWHGWCLPSIPLNVCLSPTPAISGCLQWDNYAWSLAPFVLDTRCSCSTEQCLHRSVQERLLLFVSLQSRWKLTNSSHHGSLRLGWCAGVVSRNLGKWSRSQWWGLWKSPGCEFFLSSW